MGSISKKQSKLLEPLEIGALKLSNRIVMAPLTRYRVEDNHTIMPLAAEYYAQRARAVPGTLLISEACVVSLDAAGDSNVPGIYNEEQMAAWRPIVEGVHKAGSFIFLQIWAIGRVADPEVRKREGTGEVVSSSPTPYEQGAPVPRELAEDEIQQCISAFAAAAKNAIATGFDGVEIHAANGYLIDQFTQDTCNVRTDKWGGSVENRARFALEIAKTVVDAVGASRTGIKLSPWNDFQGMKMDDPLPQFSYLTRELRKLNLAYLHVVANSISGNADVGAVERIAPLVDIWGKTSPVLLAGGLTAESAERAADVEYRDKDLAVVFGKHFISNPDLAWRIQRGIPLRKYEREYFYKIKSEEGYANYEFCEEWKRENA